ATGLNSMQEREYRAMEAADVLIVEKDPSVGAALGILPGGGSFYARSPGIGVVNLLFWPLSILWDPVSGYQGAMAINYDMTKHKLKRDMQAELSRLDDQLALEEVNRQEYVAKKRAIESKYDFNWLKRGRWFPNCPFFNRPAKAFLVHQPACPPQSHTIGGSVSRSKWRCMIMDAIRSAVPSLPLAATCTPGKDALGSMPALLSTWAPSPSTSMGLQWRNRLRIKPSASPLLIRASAAALPPGTTMASNTTEGDAS